MFPALQEDSFYQLSYQGIAQKVYNHSPGQNIGVGSLSPSPEDLSNPGIKSRSPALQADSLPAEPQGKPYTNSGKVEKERKL